MIDPANYSTLKAKNAIVSISSSGDSISIITHRPEEASTFSTDAIQGQIADYQASITTLNQTISSLQSILTDAGA